ncbi:DUF1707 SHOCT-like domain-containing protein [Nocardia transvalensis]|uniref:DUF1707 SHOCT-like domain-containing protein n=1 Tax=Nocardia transvalensis TaxID=37333 RepID=UPI00189361AF|nr:DUF1707 domain-containing protein [Nocardia transvalensis]MBF6334039.1 DUF1707 domain-containing protein [Nocardia transvalensis]
MAADSPDIRIGTEEREQAMRRLSDHFAAGRLSVAEFDERSAIIAAAVTRGDLAQVFTDLPEPAGQPPAPAEKGGRGKREWREPMMVLVVIAAVVLFFTTNTWLWFLAIPAAGVVFGLTEKPGERERREQRRLQRRERRQRRQRRLER